LGTGEAVQSPTLMPVIVVDALSIEIARRAEQGGRPLRGQWTATESPVLEEGELASP